MSEPLAPRDPEQVGSYRLLGRLGSGGMGVVYLGRSRSGLLVAIKTVRLDLVQEPGYRERFAREVTAAGRVSGVFTAAVVEADAAADLPWLATAYVRAPSLHDLVKQAGPLPPDAVRWLGAGIAEALHSIHRAGLIHRDLKPSNVLVTRENPKVIDFGLARAADPGADISRTVLGTPSFMAPEQAQDTASVTWAADVYSLGGTLLFAATGHAPYTGNSAVSVLAKLISKPPDLTGLPEELGPLVRACLARRPSDRPNPSQLVDALGGEHTLSPAALEIVHQYEGREVIPPLPGWKPGRRGVLLTLAGLGATAAAGAWGVTLLRGEGPRGWSYPTGGEVYSSPTVVGGVVYVGSNDGFLYALDTSGRRLWRYQAGAAITSSPAVAAGVVYVGGADSKIHAVRDGKAVWTVQVGAVLHSSPAVVDGVLYIGCRDRNLYAVDAAGGKVKWRFQCGPADGPVQGFNSSPTVADGVVYVGSRDRNIYAIDAATGERRWAYPTGSTVDSSPAVSNGKVFVGGDDRKVYALHTSDGSTAWQPFETGGGVVSSPVIAEGVLYVGSDDGKIYARNASTGRPYWEFATGRYIRSSPVLAGGVLYVGSADRNLYAVDAATGKQHWRFPTQGPIDDSSPAVASGLVFVGSLDHHVYAIDTRTGTL
jgi:outer membrane protein assembly factor BamB